MKVNVEGLRVVNTVRPHQTEVVDLQNCLEWSGEAVSRSYLLSGTVDTLRLGLGPLSDGRGCTRAQPDSPPRTLVVWYRCIGKDLLGSLYCTSVIDIPLTRALF